MNLDLGAESDVRSTWKLSLSDLHPDDLTDERTPQGEVSYTFDGTRRRTSMTVSGQPAVSYTWDNANRLAGITQSGTLGTTSVAFGYDNSNRRTSLTLPNGIVLSYAYDNDSRVTGMSWMSALNQVGDLEYSYDADGHVIEKTGSLATTGIPSAVSGNAFNAANEMTAFNGTPLTYDLNGNLLNDGTNIYTWDAKNHLSTLAGSGTVATSASFIYDPLGRRLEKTINQQTTAFLYDGLNPVQELTPSGLGQFAPTATMLTGLGIDEFFQRSDANGAQSFIRDSLGSTLALTNAAGSTSTSYTYEPFGNVSINPSATNTNPYQFTGRENDGTGLDYYRARYYAPSQQRFTAQDPLGSAAASKNLYSYTNDDPVNMRDPSGEQSFSQTHDPTGQCKEDKQECLQRTNQFALKCAKQTCEGTLLVGAGCFGICAGTGPAYPACVLTCEEAAGAGGTAALASCKGIALAMRIYCLEQYSKCTGIAN